MQIIEYSTLTSEALKIYFDEPNRWMQYLKDLSNFMGFENHKRWYFYFFTPQLWEESERRSPGYINQVMREDLFYQNFQILKLKAQGIQPPSALLQKVARKQRQYEESERKIFENLKNTCKAYNSRRK